MDATIPDGATLANHRADGHGGATHDVIRDGMIIGVHTSQRRNQCGIITPAQYHPHEKPFPVRTRPLETYYTEDPPDDWTPPGRPYQPPPRPVVQRVAQPPGPRMTPRTRRRIPALRPEPQVLSQGRKLLYRLTCAYQDRPVTAAGLAAAADTPCHQSGGPVWWDEETQFWTGPLVWAAGLKDTAATEAELFSALIPRWRENGVTVRSQRTKGIASRHTLRSW